MPRYSLRKGLGVWQLLFDGEEALLQHEQGIHYVAWLLRHPAGMPLHGLELAAKAAPARARSNNRAAAGIAEDAALLQRNLGMDDAEAARALWRKQRELEAIIESDDESEPVKSEASRELEAMAGFQAKHLRRGVDASQRAVLAVRRAIQRFHRHLEQAVDAAGKPHRVLRAFAAHLERHILAPSRRWAGSRRSGSYAGCFTYEPPAGVEWE